MRATLLIIAAFATTAAIADVPFQQLADFGKGGSPIDVNADGVIAGSLRAADDSNTVPVIWQTPTSAPVELPNSFGGSASAINSNGQVAGIEFREVGAGVKAVLWENGEKVTLPDLGESGYAYDINEAGVIVGAVTNEQGEYIACRWVNRQLELLPVPDFSAPDQQVWSIARSINSAGIITGTIQGANGTPSIALRWDDTGAVTTVITDGLETKGISIDNGGSVLLTGYFDGGYSRGPARVDRDGSVVTLPVPAELLSGAPATTMSRTGIVAGYCYGRDAQEGFIIQAVAWPNDQFTRLAMPAGMKYAFPLGVGNNGLVFGSASGDTSSYSVPGYWALPIEASLVQSSGSSGAPGQVVELTATSARVSGKKNVAHSVALRVNGVTVGQALTNAQGMARVAYRIPADFTGSSMSVSLVDENGAKALTSIAVTPSCVAADLDCNGSVDSSDVALLLLEYGNTGPADLDGSGSIDYGDLALLMLDWTG